MVRVAYLTYLLLLLLPNLAYAQSYERYSQSVSRLIAEHQVVDPATGTSIALDIVPDQDWHTYWVNPGDSGAAPILNYVSPIGNIQFSDLSYPVPRRFDVGPLTSFGYDQRLLLITDIPPFTVPPGLSEIDIQLEAEYLVCKVACIPAIANFKLKLSVGRSAKLSQHAQAFQTTRRNYPRKLPAWHVRASGQPPKLEIGKSVITEDFLLAPDSGLSLSKPHIAQGEDHTVIHFAASDSATQPPENIAGLLVVKQDGERIGYQVDTKIGPAQAPATPLATILFFAFLGGLLLNLMPCVLPVISIKMLTITQHAEESSGRIRWLTSGYIFGVLTSLWALGGSLIALRASGVAMGWGFQLQNPKFVMAMILLFFLIGANLLGWLAVNWVPQADLAKGKSSDSFFYQFLTGLLAVAVATPCTAPFMGAAIGAALSQSSSIALLIFTSLGLGLAAPYGLLMISPKLVQRLPKPGLWMETLRQVLAFPMFATSIWLIWVFMQQTSATATVIVLSSLLGLGFACWLSQRYHRVGLIGLVVISCTSLAIPLPSSETNHSHATQRTSWRSFSPELVAELRKDQPVFIDFTAAWCITCQVNKKVTFTNPRVVAFLKQKRIATIKADWTKYDPVITKVLEQFNRAGVPMYLFYPGGDNPPKVLPELLTPDIFMKQVSSHLLP